MIAMRFTLARRLGRSDIDKGDENMKDINETQEEVNLFNMPQNEDNQDVPPEDKVIDVNEDIENVSNTDTSENNENVQNERIDNNMGEVHELNVNTNGRDDDETMREKLRNLNKGISNLNSGNVSDSTDSNDEGEKGEDQELKDMANFPSLSNKSEEKLKNQLKTWELENCSPVLINKKIGKYSTQMSCGLLATMANDGVIYYNENTQRSRKKKANGETTPYLMASKVKKIYKELISGELNGMLITLNSRIIKDENGNILNPLTYDEENNRTLFGSGVLDCVDGWHRVSASIIWLRKWNIKKNQSSIPSPWDYEFIVAIEHKEEVGGGLIFKEYGSTQLKIQGSKVKFLDVYDYANMIVRKLMTNSLRDKVETDKTRTKGTNNIVTFATLSDAIKKNYKINTEEDVESISNYLNKFFNKLINLFPDYFGNISKEERDLKRQQDLTLELQMFHGYVAISSRLYEKDNWETSLSKLKDTIQIGEWNGTILQTDCPLWDRIFRGGEDRKIVSSSVTRTFVSKTLGDYIEFGIDQTVKNIKEDDEKKLEKLNK